MNSNFVCKNLERKNLILKRIEIKFEQSRSHCLTYVYVNSLKYFYFLNIIKTTWLSNLLQTLFWLWQLSKSQELGFLRLSFNFFATAISICTANAYRQTTDKLMFKSVISIVR